MWNNRYGIGAFGFGPFGFGAGIFLVVIVIWSVVWKGFALWKAAREGSRPWFAALLVINTLGILEILYLYVFSKHKSNSSGSK